MLFTLVALVHGAAALLVPLPPSAPLVRAAVAPAATSAASYPSPFPVSSVTLTLSNEEAPPSVSLCHCAPEPPYRTHWRRVPASCVLHVPEAQGSLPRGPTLRPHTVAPAVVVRATQPPICLSIYLSIYLSVVRRP